MTVASPPPPPQNPYGASPTGPQPKKTSPWVWVGVGCLAVLLVIAGSCFFVGNFLKNKVKEFADDPNAAAAKIVEFAVKGNPDVEFVKSDKDAKTVTLKDKKTGKEFTLSFEDIQNGKFSMEGEDGSKVEFGNGSVQVTDDKGTTSTLGVSATSNLPSWLPLYPGATTQGSYSATGTNNASATVLQTADGVDQVLAFYKEKLEGEGFKVDTNSYSANGQVAGGTVTAKGAAGKGEVTIVVAGQPGETSITISLTDGK